MVKTFEFVLHSTVILMTIYIHCILVKQNNKKKMAQTMVYYVTIVTIIRIAEELFVWDRSSIST